MNLQIVPQVELFDTSLRDGMQQPNLEISVPNAVSLLQRMSAFGLHYAEIGFAGAHQFVSDLTRALEDVDTGAMKLALFGRSRGRGAKVAEWPDVQFIVEHKQHVPVAVVVVKSRLLDVVKSLETTPEENLLMAQETVAYLQDQGLEVIVDLEHAMDAAWSRQEYGARSDTAFAREDTLDYFYQVVAQCARQRSEPDCGVRYDGWRESRGGGAHHRRMLVRNHPDMKIGFHGHTDRGFGCGEYAGGDSRGRMPHAGHDAWHGRTLRQCESDDGGGQHAAARRGGVCHPGSR